ncbi:FtsH protease activity modulator HflK [Azohydromonas sp.]|uniref:FtsH protease activity modulator HflK n=1 Tax=Azohydromonas sp. TaxID=1872666 RepID=UPI002B6A2E6F|nr:FtsH protease activity modulator HflK [Azohydromonas sp.]HMM85103.1 FtsH protease activity modulator HflK [Azohydromonas sp.]
MSTHPFASESEPLARRLGAVAAAARALASAALRRRRAADTLVLSGGRNDGPPDLDELWKDFNGKLSNLFGGKKAPRRNGGGEGGGGGGGPSFQPPDMKSAGIGVGLIAGVVALIWLGSGVYIVQEGQQAVVTTFGRYSATVDAGIQWRLPYPFQAHETVPFTQLRSVDIGRNTVTQATGLRDSSMLTQDENIVDIRFTVQYRLNDSRAYLFENRNPDEAVVLASESAVREIVGRSQVDSVLYAARDAIAADLVRSVQNQLDRLKAGILVTNVNIQNVQVPEQVQAAFNDAVRAGADRDRFRNEGEAYASDVIPKAQGTAARLREEAEGYRARIVATAEGDAQRFRSVLAEYQRAPGVTRDRLYLETMQEVYANVSKVLVDSRSGSNLLYLPLEQLIRQGASAPAAPAARTDVPSPATSGAAALTLDARSRDGQRSRERDVR